VLEGNRGEAERQAAENVREGDCGVDRAGSFFFKIGPRIAEKTKWNSF